MSKYSYYTKTESGDATIFDVHPSVVGPGAAIAWSLFSILLFMFPFMPIAAATNSPGILLIWVGFVIWRVFATRRFYRLHEPRKIIVTPEGIRAHDEFPNDLFYKRDDIAELTVFENGRQISSSQPSAFVVGGGIEGAAFNMASAGAGVVMASAQLAGTLLARRNLLSQSHVIIRRKRRSEKKVIAMFMTRETAADLIEDVIGSLNAKPWPGLASQDLAAAQ